MRLFTVTIFMMLSCSALANVALANSHRTDSNSPAVTHFNQTYTEAPALSDGYVTVNDVQYHYVTAGEGPLVILYHGFPSFWYAWKFQLAELAKHYTVVAVDGLGSNLSDKPAAIERYRIDRLADDLNQLALQLGGNQPFRLIGHDWGGTLSWYFAQVYPERLERLVVLNAPPYQIFQHLLRENEQQKKTSRYINFLSHSWGEALLSLNDSYLIWKMAYQKHLDHDRISPDEAALFRQALAKHQALHSAINWYRANFPAASGNPPVEAIDNKIVTPSLLIWGENDPAFVSEFIDMLPDTVEQLSIERFSDAAHWPALSHAKQVNQTLIDFLATSSETAGVATRSRGAVIPSAPTSP